MLPYNMLMCAKMHVLVWLLLACPIATAQSLRGSIAGRVTDAAARALPDIGLTITEEHTGRVRHARTSHGGDFLFTPLPAGVYRLDPEAPATASPRAPLLC